MRRIIESRVFIRVLRFLIEHSIWIRCAFMIAGFSVGMHYRVKNIKAEIQEIEEIYEAVSDVCELGGNVWSWEDKTCYSPSRMQKIHRHKPTSKGLL